jgi:hypothetical protein
MPARDDKGHWLPGVSGNPNGRPRDTFTPILAEKYSDEETVRALVDKLHEMAAGGNLQALMYVMDRNIGKPRQAMDIVADVNEAVGLTIVRAGDSASTDTAST